MISMLKRVQKISGVGCFYDCHMPRVQFEPITFIYGENCYGKSTFCDILRSFKNNNPSLITQRKSIPEPSDSDQEIVLNINLPDGNEDEAVFVFSHNEWNPSFPYNGCNLFIFDTDFVNKNVFTGLTIER